MSTTVSRIEFPIDFPPGRVAAYLLDGDEVFLFDTGPAPTATEGEASLAERCDYSLEAIDHVFLTHPHPDHVGRLRELAEAGDAEVYAPFTARDRLRRPSETVDERVRATVDGTGFEAETRERLFDAERRLRRQMRTNLPFDAVDRWVVDDQRVSVGGRTVRAVRTPGHYVDHHCYLTEVDGELALFSGDMAIEPFRAVLLNNRLDREYRNAVVGYRRSLDRLARHDVDRVYPGHGPVHAAVDETLRRDRESLRRRVDGVYDALREGPVTAAEVADAVVGEGDAAHLFPEIMSALAHLVNRGRATRERDDGVVRYSA